MVGAEIASRLVQRDVNLALDDNGLAIDAHGIAFGIDLGAEEAYGLAIERNPAGLNQLFAMTTGGNARFGKMFLQAYEHDRATRYSGLVLGRPNTRWPSFQRPCFLSAST